MIAWLYKRWRVWREGKTWREANTRYILEDGTVSPSPPPIYGYAKPHGPETHKPKQESGE